MKQRLKSLLKKWFPTIHPLPAKRLARWEKKLLATPPDIKYREKTCSNVIGWYRCTFLKNLDDLP
ncbi:hypothetical protein [Photorhabdus sp. SF281]|uniref:hypothetical protein n=1 Tax=Photorhabdus sp. SF281 TaxID=3459527 RepID=UPI004044C4C9